LRQYRTTAYQDDGIDVEMNDNIITEITLSFQRAFEGPMRRLSDKLVHKAVELYGSKDERNCLTNWLDSLQWDKTPRLDHWLSRYCGAEDNVYVREVARCWLLGAVARAYKPGCKFDFCLVMEGEQGIGKSTALEILSNGWIVQLKTFDDKKAIENIQGKWIVEIEELDAFRKSETETIKSFISASKDRYCLKYIKYAQDWPRTCVFAGTTNKTDYLKDETGNRRFWPVWCNHIDLEALANDRDQLLAEAVHRYRQNEPMLLNQEAQGIAKEQQDDRYAGDVWEEMISSYVENKKEIKMSELFEHLGFSEAKDYTRWDQTRLGKIMSKLNWEKRRSSAPGRPTVYRSPTSK
jgi:putative DNA primase/helicase